MPYVVNKPGMKVTRDGKPVDLKVGDEVPECTTWPTFQNHLNIHNIVWMPSGQAHPSASNKPTPVQQQGPRK